MTTFFKIFQSPDTPNIPSVHTAVVNQQLQNFLDQAMKHFISGLNKVIDYNRTDFAEFLDGDYLKIKKLTVLGFKATKKMGMKTDEDAFIKRLESEMEDYYKGWKKTCIDTWNTMQREKKENEKKVKGMEIENQRKIDEANRIKTAELQKIQDDFKIEKEAIEANNTLTQQQKDDELAKIKREKDEQELNNNRTMAATIQKLKDEAAAAKDKSDAAFKQQIKDLEANGSNKTSALAQSIEATREMFTKMV
jgi:hypothetical protein